MEKGTSDKKIGIEPLLYFGGIIQFRLQRLESIIELCCVYTQVGKITLDDLLNENSEKRSATLGQMIKAVKTVVNFTPSFIERLNKLSNNRNYFIHNIWDDNQIYLLEEKISIELFKKIEAFENELSDDIYYMTRIFHGFHIAIGRNVFRRESKEEEFVNNPEIKELLPLEKEFSNICIKE